MPKIVVDRDMFLLALMALQDIPGEAREIAARLDEEMIYLSDSNYDELSRKAKILDALLERASFDIDIEHGDYWFDFNLRGVAPLDSSMEDILDFLIMDTEKEVH